MTGEPEPDVSRTLKLANVWRVLRDVDLEAIRASALARFSLLVAADAHEDAEAVQALLSTGSRANPHPWIVAGAAAGMAGPPEALLAAIIVSRAAGLSPALETVREACRRGGSPVVTVVVGAEGAAGTATVPEPGESARLVAPAIDSVLLRDLVRTLVGLAGPERRLALARQLPAARPAVFDAIIEETAQANASYALATGLAETVPLLTAPMNVGDLVVLTKNQLVMGYRLALAAGLDGDPRSLIAEILGVLGGGLLFRQVARQLVGLLPVVGLVPKVAVAYGGTVAIGRAVVVWATEGRAASADLLQRFSREGLERGREVARRMVSSARAAGLRAARRWDALRAHVPGLGRRTGRT
jgi:uncharacterized protein (DUF697 family)